MHCDIEDTLIMFRPRDAHASDSAAQSDKEEVPPPVSAALADTHGHLPVSHRESGSACLPGRQESPGHHASIPASAPSVVFDLILLLLRCQFLHSLLPPLNTHN